MSTTTCPKCNSEYQIIANHWYACGYPKLTEKQKQIMTGILMGDGSIDNRNIENKNPRFTLVNTNPDYVEYVYNELQPFSRINSYERTEKQSYKTQYRVKVTHPWLKELATWYDSGKKVFPDVELTPTILKHWYACDGHKDLRGRFTIAVENEKDNIEKLKRMFSRAGLYVSVASGQVYANKGHNSDKIFSYMESPVKGFEYKWP